MSQLTLFDVGLDDWTPDMRAEACRIMEAWILAHGGRL